MFNGRLTADRADRRRIGLAVGQAVVGAAFFAALRGSGPAAHAAALTTAVAVALGFVAAALTVGVVDLVRTRSRGRPGRR